MARSIHLYIKAPYSSNKYSTAQSDAEMLRSELCIGCAACANACPFDAIGIVDNSKRVIHFSPEKCGNCSFECNDVCPTRAIERRPDKIALEFEYAFCLECGRRLMRTKKEAEYYAQQLLKMGEKVEFAFICDECKMKRISSVSNKYSGYLI
ncbi:4Fe-4S dicluster domain-containing protein [Thermococcus sp.]